MPIDKVLSVSIANAAINASAISNTANLVIGALNTGNTVVTGTQFVNGAVTFANSTANNFYVFSNGEVSIGSSNTNAEAPLYIRTDTKSHVLHLFNSNSYTQVIYQTNSYRYQAGVGFNGETTWGVANSFFIYDAQAVNMRFVMSANGNIGIGNNVTKQAKLNFENIVGNKIDFYHLTTSGGGVGDRYGIQVQSSELRIHSGAGGDSNGGITFGKSTTNTFTEYARLTNAGYLKVPGQPAFCVYNTNNSQTGDTTVSYNSTYVNRGSCLNTGTGVFTAPTAGVYVFMFHAFMQSGYTGNPFEATFVINGSTSNVRFYTNENAGSGYGPHQHMSGMFDLAANDQVKVRLISGQFHGNQDAVFTGYLIG